MVREMISEKDEAGHGKLSFSRCLPFISAVIMALVWLGVGGLIAWSIYQDLDLGVWDEVSGWMTWGRDFLFVTVIPYAGKQAGKIGQRRPG